MSALAVAVLVLSHLLAVLVGWKAHGRARLATWEPIVSDLVPHDAPLSKRKGTKRK